MFETQEHSPDQLVSARKDRWPSTDQVYKLGRWIGSGTFGDVIGATAKRASQPQYGQNRNKDSGKEQYPPYALKCFRIEAPAEDPTEPCSVFLPFSVFLEIELLMVSTHENIVRGIEVIWSVEDELFNEDGAWMSRIDATGSDLSQIMGSTVVVMEHGGDDLDDLLKKFTYDFYLSDVLHIMRGLMRGLNYLHTGLPNKLRVIHGDLKPNNILIGPNGSVKIADLGHARVISAETTHCDLGSVVVTVPWRSPELLLGDRSMVPAIDLWAAGVICAELITGVHPFQDERELGVLRQIFEIVGEPTADSWPGFSDLPHAGMVRIQTEVRDIDLQTWVIGHERSKREARRAARRSVGSGSTDWTPADEQDGALLDALLTVLQGLLALDPTKRKWHSECLHDSSSSATESISPADDSHDYGAIYQRLRDGHWRPVREFYDRFAEQQRNSAKSTPEKKSLNIGAQFFEDIVEQDKTSTLIAWRAAVIAEEQNGENNDGSDGEGLMPKPKRPKKDSQA
eukprot:Clim_evm2s148 gene=Clim_evmTU2s148